MLEGHNFFESDSDLAKTSFSPSVAPWHLLKGEKQISINKHVAGKLKSQDILAINFLCQHFKNGFKGSILNEEDRFNVQAQVSTFLQCIFNERCNGKENFLVLVLTPEYLLQRWKEKLEYFGGFKVQVIGSKTHLEDFEQESGLALLLTFDNIKLAETLSEYNFFSIVIDHFDEVANKLIIKKLEGEFHIGVTQRNFYINPDQKLQWTMLNWVHPGAVGRLIDFYEADNDNFANLRDNYHHWWLILTWEYCENFKIPSDDEEESNIQKVASKRRNTRRKKITKKTKRGSYKIEQAIVDEVKQTMHNSDHGEKQDEPTKESDRNTERIKISPSSDSSQDTIEYSVDTEEVSEFSKDINRRFSKIKENDHDNVLLNIIEGVSKSSSSDTIEHQSQVDLKKEELYSQLFDDIPESRAAASSSPDDVLLSLI